MDFSLSERETHWRDRVRAFIDTHVAPREADYLAEQSAGTRWKVLKVVDELKVRAHADGLWNLFMPPGSGDHHVDTSFAFDGPGLTNLEYALCAEEMGRIEWSSEVFNCSAPDTGNMEVFHRYGTRAQKLRWLQPLMEGRIRSAFLMTEPGVASSDATNIETRIVRDGDDYVINGRKWWSSGAGDPRCEIAIVMGKSDPTAARHQQQSMILVPMATPGVEVLRMLPVFGFDDAPHGHAEVLLNNVRVPADHMLLGEGRGFEIAQGRLGPGRIHHCMRVIGSAERALKLLCERALSRTAFGKPLTQLGGNVDIIANARIGIEQARLLTLKAAWLMDTVGVKGAMSEISQIKVVAPNLAQMVIDQAMQIHGGAGMCEDFPLAAMFANARLLRLADGPDEVHRALIAKLELKPHADRLGLAPVERDNSAKSLIDQPSPVRSGEEFDVAKVDAFLKKHVPGVTGQPTVGQFRGGASNLTYQLNYPDCVFILRRPPFGHRTGSAHDMLREARVMTALKQVYLYVPKVLANSAAGEVLDCPFYVMERVNGIILRRDLPKGMTLNAADTRKLCMTVIDRLIELHQVDYRAAGLEHLGKGEGYVFRQVDGWCDRFNKAKTDDAGDFVTVMAWLKQKMPAHDLTTCIIHNDFRLDNVVLDPKNPLSVKGVLDWEMATLGDPLMDLGNSLAYWIEAGDEPAFQAVRRQPTHLPGMLTRREVIDYYSQKTGYPVDNIDFHLVFGLFRLAVIAQQIYYRFRQGHAKNPEFANFIHFTNLLEKRCLDLIERSAVKS